MNTTLDHRLSALVDRAVIAESNVAALEESLKVAKKTYADLVEQEIPSLLEEFGLTSATTDRGLTVKTREEIYANISEARRPAAFAWLNENGHGGIVKRNFVVPLTADHDARLLATTVQGITGIEPVLTESVHPQTLRAFIREALDTGMDLPVETFGVFVKKVARIA